PSLRKTLREIIAISVETRASRASALPSARHFLPWRSSRAWVAKRLCPTWLAQRWCGQPRDRPTNQSCEEALRDRSRRRKADRSPAEARCSSGSRAHLHSPRRRPCPCSRLAVGRDITASPAAAWPAREGRHSERPP